MIHLAYLFTEILFTVWFSLRRDGKKEAVFFSRHIEPRCQSHLPHGPQIAQFDFKWAQPVKPMHNDLFK